MDLLRQARSENWASVTFRSIAARLGISERTVYRYFPTEEELHRAVLLHAVVMSGAVYEQLRLEELPEAVAATIGWLQVGSEGGRPSPEPSFLEEDLRRRQALLEAVGRAGAPSGGQRAVAAAALDLLWDVRIYLPLVARWGLSSDEVEGVARWIVSLAVSAVAAGRLPGAGPADVPPADDQM